jgi:iduronate 2-sulfatase
VRSLANLFDDRFGSRSTKVWDLNTDFRETIPDAVTLPQLFQRNGYYTARAGKIYHYNNSSEIGTPGFDDALSWQAVSHPAGYDRTHDEALVTFYAPQQIKEMNGNRQNNRGRGLAPALNGSQVPWKHGGKGPSGIRIAQDGRTPILPLSKNGDLGIAIAGHASDGSDEMMTDFMVSESAIAMIEEHRNDPWFIGSGFFRPHVPFVVPSKYFDLYDLDDLQLPRLDPNELSVAPALAYNSLNPNYGMTEQQHREAMRAHFAAISFVDAQVGRLIDAVHRLGLMENTTIVFWADHGFMVGEHGQWEKTMLFEDSVHVPLFISGAGVTAKGKACKRTVEHLNIYPTLAELCELKGVPESLQGRSMVPLLSNPENAWDPPAISQVGRRLAPGPIMGYSLRTERYRYTMWGEEGAEGEELYDYDLDQREVINLAKSSNAATLKSNLRAQLHEISRARKLELKK